MAFTPKDVNQKIAHIVSLYNNKLEISNELGFVRASGKYQKANEKRLGFRTQVKLGKGGETTVYVSGRLTAKFHEGKEYPYEITAVLSEKENDQSKNVKYKIEINEETGEPNFHLDRKEIYHAGAVYKDPVDKNAKGLTQTITTQVQNNRVLGHQKAHLTVSLNDSQTPGMVEPFIPSENCLQHLQEIAKLDNAELEPALLQFMQKILQAIQSFHDQGFVHNDIKLENMLYGDPVVLIDHTFINPIGNINNKAGTLGYLYNYQREYIDNPQWQEGDRESLKKTEVAREKYDWTAFVKSFANAGRSVGVIEIMGTNPISSILDDLIKVPSESNACKKIIEELQDKITQHLNKNYPNSLANSDVIHAELGALPEYERLHGDASSNFEMPRAHSFSQIQSIVPPRIDDNKIQENINKAKTHVERLQEQNIKSKNVIENKEDKQISSISPKADQKKQPENSNDIFAAYNKGQSKDISHVNTQRPAPAEGMAQKDSPTLRFKVTNYLLMTVGGIIGALGAIMVVTPLAPVAVPTVALGTAISAVGIFRESKDSNIPPHFPPGFTK